MATTAAPAGCATPVGVPRRQRRSYHLPCDGLAARQAPREGALARARRAFTPSAILAPSCTRRRAMPVVVAMAADRPNMTPARNTPDQTQRQLQEEGRPSDCARLPIGRMRETEPQARRGQPLRRAGRHKDISGISVVGRSCVGRRSLVPLRRSLTDRPADRRPANNGQLTTIDNRRRPKTGDDDDATTQDRQQTNQRPTDRRRRLWSSVVGLLASVVDRPTTDRPRTADHDRQHTATTTTTTMR